tara:strand:- start:414 stop:1496 length:1083 start_codon:yes stop_codon:yes gene_type:complete
MAYTDIDKPSDYFETILYTGNGSTLNVGGLDFTQNFTWIKNRSDGTSHFLYDTIRGAGNNKDLRSNSDGAEGSGDGATHGFMSAFRSDGFTVTQGSSTASITNASGNSYASWNWKAGTSVSGDTTGSGTLKTYTGSVNTDSGFSIISFTGNGTSGHTIPHNLGVAPAMVILKRYDSSNNWRVGHNGLTSWEYRLTLEATEAQTSQSAVFNSTAPTSSVVTLGNSGSANGNGATYIMYSFAEKQGYSKFGSYTGNGNADGTFVYTGFKPAFVMSKCTSHAGEDWNINDNKRPGYNVIQNALLPNSNSAEVTASFQAIDTLSNGFKWRGTNDRVNASGKSYIYMAFASSPFTTSSGVPTTAR